VRNEKNRTELRIMTGNFDETSFDSLHFASWRSCHCCIPGVSANESEKRITVVMNSEYLSIVIDVYRVSIITRKRRGF